MQPNFNIREIDEDEMENVLPIIEEIFPDAEIDVDEFDRIFVAEILDDILGFVHISETPRKIIVQGLGVEEDYRNQGVGSALMERVVDIAEVSDKSIYMMAQGLNPAVNFYEKFGFYASKFGAENHLLVKRAHS